ncbi:hypothetical protein F9B85_00260 [Heliorestis acidaminivorans]|uniref:Uncharacterized protein n=1 Tax=Heliorestis acidaminivorans TaxID=553427 RepID=A0A6I0F5A1_9FIRM|nr:hypothetical protein [Heliorestis acidaminivorans]KAB2954172.1 hypothetical protein F9B85_00260 [Heliorestis acidaminivorans]
MTAKIKINEEMKGSMGLLISILARYPEVGTVTYDPLERMIQFSFLLHQDAEEKKMKVSAAVIEEALLLFHKLTKTNPQLLNVKVEKQNPISSLYINRDVDSLTFHEIALLVELLKQQVGSFCLSEKDNSNIIEDDEQLWQEEMITHLLDNLPGNEPSQSLYAYREEGRVMVFNK